MLVLQKKYIRQKGRPSDNPLIIHIAQLEDLDKIAEDVPDGAKKTGRKILARTLTMIFKKKDIVPIETTGGLESVAVRMPSHKVARALICYGGNMWQLRVQILQDVQVQHLQSM